MGTTTNTFEVTDGAGLTATCSFDVTVNDTEDPAITCPADITTSNDTGDCSAVVTYTDPVASDNCDSGVATVDQQNLDDSVCMAAFSQGGTAQSFVPSSNTMSGASIKIISGTGTGDITIKLYDNLPNNGGVLLANGTVTGISAGEWADVTWSSVSVTPGDTYYIDFSGTNGGLCIAGSLNNPYANGQVYACLLYTSPSPRDY